MNIDADFDGGNIIIDELTESTAILRIRPDSSSDDYQWFYFRAEGPADISRTYRIVNADNASYPGAWNGYQVLASYDERDWFRVPTRYDGSHLIIEHQASSPITSYAFFVPYPATRRSSLLIECETSPHVSRRRVGTSNQGRSVDLLVFGDENRPETKRIWIVTRQHAGEPMAEWATEGIIRRLLDKQDTATQNLLDRSTIYVVPNMNPDGSTLGNLRANAEGIDLNRVWHEPGPTAPEVINIRETIAASGVDYFIDVHGDETRPFIWIAHPGGELPPQLQEVQDRFEQKLSELNPEVQPAPEEIVVGVRDAPGMSINYLSKTYGCPAWIIELPFKETAVGDTLLADGCMRFGRTCLDALLSLMP